LGYDSKGQRTSMIDAKNRTTTYTYDARGRQLMMPNVWIDAGLQVVRAKLHLGALVVAVERQADIGTRLRIRRLAHAFEFRINLFLRRLEELPDAAPFGQFDFHFLRLDDIDLVHEEILIVDPVLAGQCMIAIIEAETSLASAVVLLLNSPIPWPVHPLCKNPVHAIGKAKRALDQIKEPIKLQHPEGPPIDRPHDDHLWSYVDLITPTETMHRL
jgi:YD repeat-containing protein